MSKKIYNHLVLNIIADADALAKQHEVFVEQYVTRANDELYNILSKLMSICLHVQASDVKDNIIHKMRKTLREDFGIKTQTNSRVASIVVRYVVRSNRKTAHIYGRAIEIAIADGIKPEELPDYIHKKGGVDAIRKSVVTAEVKNKNQAVKKIVNKCLTQQFYKKKPIGEVQFVNNSLLPYAVDVEFTYLICATDSRKPGLQVVGSLYPCKELESKALEFFSLTSIVMSKYGTNEFNKICIENDFNPDLMIRWMKTNGFNEGTDAQNFVTELKNSVKTSPKVNEEKKYETDNLDSFQNWII
jgi:hypothetical protein